MRLSVFVVYCLCRLFCGVSQRCVPECDVLRRWFGRQPQSPAEKSSLWILWQKAWKNWRPCSRGQWRLWQIQGKTCDALPYRNTHTHSGVDMNTLLCPGCFSGLRLGGSDQSRHQNFSCQQKWWEIFWPSCCQNPAWNRWDGSCIKHRPRIGLKVLEITSRKVL